MYESKQGRTPKATHYVSLSNGDVYPAMKNLPGYEDDNPGDWRIANAAEIEAYREGKRLVPEVPNTVALDAPPPETSAPRTVQLAPEDPPPAPQAVLQQAAAALPPAPPTTPSDPPPMPAFNGIPGLPSSGFGQNG